MTNDSYTKSVDTFKSMITGADPNCFPSPATGSADFTLTVIGKDLEDVDDIEAVYKAGGSWCVVPDVIIDDIENYSSERIDCRLNLTVKSDGSHLREFTLRLNCEEESINDTVVLKIARSCA